MVGKMSKNVVAKGSKLSKNSVVDKEEDEKKYEDDSSEYEEYEDDEEEESESSDNESDEDEDADDESDDGNESDSSTLNIGKMSDNIDLKDISDDELSFEEIDDDQTQLNDYLTKVLYDNDEKLNLKIENDKRIKSKIQSIANDIAPVQTGLNLAKVNEYEYDSSDEEDVLNTIGNIPYEWYKEYSHIGYDVDGRKIVRPPKEDEIDEFLRKMDDPTYWRTVKDNLTGQKVILTDEDIDLIKRIRNAKCPDPTYDPYAPFIDFFTFEKMIHPVTNRPETKASFIPSLSEKRIVSKLVSAIKKARLNPKPKVKKDSQFNFAFDLWETEGQKNKRNERYIPAPKQKPPGHEESYNPPPEYLFNEEEKKEWLEQEPEDRKINFIPKTFPSLRQVPAYPEFTRERFERCLDLYLCPRARKNKIQIDPEDLIPQLPKPADLQPFPSIQSLIYTGHQGKVLSISVEPNGQFFVSGDDCGVLKIWEILTARCFKTIQFDGPITNVGWYPNATKSLISLVIDKNVYIVNAGIGEKQVIVDTDSYFTNWNAEQENSINAEQDENPVVEWDNLNRETNTDDWNKGIRVIIKHKFGVRQVAWHAGGDYFATVMPSGANKSVVIHNFSKKKSQVPFKRSKDIIQCVQFHPTRAYFFVATKKSIRIYDLIKQSMTKKLVVNCNEVSSMAIHPGGDNIIVGSMDPRVQWFDLDLSTKAYKTLRYHKKAIRNVSFHRSYPLFGSASDDGTVVICHGMVYDDLLQNALLVPVKVLKAQDTKENSAMTDCTFHPIQPWIFASSSNNIRLFT